MATELEKAIFFHLPRTGGTWLVKMLNDNFECSYFGHKHISPRQFYVQRNNEKKYKFSFVRNPIYWYISKFSSPTHIYRLNNNSQLSHSEINPIFQTDALNIDETFNEWLWRNINERPGWLTEYHKWFYGENFEFVDYIGTYENQLKDLRQIFKNSGQSFNVNFFKEAKNRNVTKMEPAIRLTRKYSCKYTKSLLKALIKSEKYLFKKFNYSTYIKSYKHLLIGR